VKKYVVSLSEQEENQLRKLTRKGKTGARRLRSAHVLLLADEGRTDEEVSSALGTVVRTVERARKRFVVWRTWRQCFSEQPDMP
jgi:Homeodomain-like domain-containing protein